MNFIIVITGPTGSGKSTVAERIARAINKCVNIDADLVKHFIHSDFIYDDTPQGVEQWKLLGANIGQLAKNFNESGYNVIINGYINEPAWGRIQAYVKIDSKFLLLPEVETTAIRDLGRNPDIVMGKEAVKTHTDYFSTSPYYLDYTRIDSTNQSIDQTVTDIQNTLKNNGLMP